MGFLGFPFAMTEVMHNVQRNGEGSGIALRREIMTTRPP